MAKGNDVFVAQMLCPMYKSPEIIYIRLGHLQPRLEQLGRKRPIVLENFILRH